jgi:hypothetical protein
LLFFWAWGLWAIYRALILDQKRAWYEVGIAIGLGALSKLSMGLLPLMAGLAILFNRAWWHHLRCHQLWFGLLLTLTCLSPMLIWNAHNDWVSLRHEESHIENEHWSLIAAAEFLIGQWLVLSPIVASLALSALWKKPRQSGHTLLWMLGLGWLMFFILKAATGKIQLNWPAPIYIGLIVLFAGMVPELGTIKRKILYGGLFSSILIFAVLLFPMHFGLNGDQDPFKKNKYWAEPISILEQRLPSAQFILTDNYRLAAELAFYWPQPLPVYITGSESRRFNQHDLWPGIAREEGNSALYINDEPQPHPLLSKAFAKCTPYSPLVVTAWDGKVIRTLHPYYCQQYQPIEWPTPERF